jgi:hypothetical protein
MTLKELERLAENFKRGQYNNSTDIISAYCAICELIALKSANTRTPSATVRFYDMPDGTVGIDVEHIGRYKRTKAQVCALKSVDVARSSVYRLIGRQSDKHET